MADDVEILTVLHHEGHDHASAASVSGGQAVALDMSKLALASISSGVVTISGANIVSVDYGGVRYSEFSGEFAYGATAAAAAHEAASVGAGDDVYDGIALHHEDHEHGTYPSSGRITRIQEYNNGALVMDARGLSADASAVFGLLRAGNVSGALDLLFNGADSFTGSPLGDVMMGAAGADMISGGGGADSLDGGTGGDTILGGEGGDLIRGLEDADSIDGGGGNDDLNGNTGADTVRGGEGADSVRGGQGDDRVFGDAGDDAHVNGNIGNDEVRGGDGSDTIFGGQDNDTLFGEAGNDWLSGDLGQDILNGGAGADRFIIRAGGGIDWVVDFNSTEGDRVQLAAGTAYTLTIVAGQVVVDLGGATQLGLAGVTMATLGDWLILV